MDAGTYLVTKTLYVPPGARIVGESYSVIMSSGAYFNDVKNPKAVVQIGAPGEQGRVEWSDMIVSTQGGNTGQMGAILIEWNLAAPATSPSGMWEYVLPSPISLMAQSQVDHTTQLHADIPIAYTPASVVSSAAISRELHARQLQAVPRRPSSNSRASAMPLT